MSLSFNNWLQQTYSPTSGGGAGYGGRSDINQNTSGLTNGKMQYAYDRGLGGEIIGNYVIDDRTGERGVYHSQQNYAGIPQANYQFGDTNVLGGIGAQPYMKAQDGSFIGYGSSIDDLRGDSRLSNLYSEYVAADPQLEAQRIENRQAEQDFFNQQLAARQAAQQALPSVGNVGASQLTGTPTNNQFGGAIGNGGLLNFGGLHRGASGGTGLLGGGGQ
jgi:hypothetical protein